MSIRAILATALTCLAIAAAHAQQPAAPGAAPAAGATPPRQPMTNTFPPGNPKLLFDTRPAMRIFTTDVLAHDVEKSAKYYQDVFGMKIYWRRGNGGFQSIFLAFPSPDGKTLATPVLRIMNDEKFVHAQSLPHLVVLAPASEFPGLVARAAAAGYPAQRNSPSLLYLPDPTGNIVEVSPVQAAYDFMKDNVVTQAPGQ